MANQTGRGFSIPELNRTGGSINGAPAVQYATSPASSPAVAQTYSTIADVLKSVSNRVADRLDVQAKVEGAKAGQLAGMKGVPQLKDDTTIRGEAFNIAARDAVQTQFELNGRLILSDYEQKNPADPVAFKKQSDSYLQGAMTELQNFDPAVAQRYEAEFKLRQDAAVNRINDKYQAIVKDRQTEDALRLQISIQNEMSQQASSLFTGGPENVQKTLAQMVGNAAKLVDASHQIGPDGTPLFSARERVSAEMQAEQLVSEQIGLAWLQTQPNMIEAFDNWKKGKATISVVDDKGNATEMPLREMLGASGYASAEEAFIKNLKSELALQSQINTVKDHDFKQNSDTLYGDLSVLAQDGKLTVPVLEASKAQLEPDRYVALRSIARGGGASVSDGATLARLSTQDINGVDIKEQLQQEFKNGKLATADYIRLYDRNTERLNRGVDNPVSTGRDFVGNSLGKLSTELGFAQSIAIPKAEAEYSTRIDDFIKKNERQPTTSEALDIGRDVVRRYSVMDTTTTIANMPLPMFMTPAQKFSGDLKAADIEETARRTRASFLKQHNNDAAATDADERYQEEMKLLKDYFDLIKVRDGNAGQPATTK